MVWIDGTEIDSYLLLVLICPVHTHVQKKEKWTEQKVISDRLALIPADDDTINYCH